MKLLTIIMLHKEAEEVAKRNLKIWEKLHTKINDKIIFTAPKDSNLDSMFGEVLIGEAEHHGEKSAQRIIEIIKYMIDYPGHWDYYMLMEYDAIALDITDDMLPQPGGVSAIVYPQNKPFEFSGRYYLHYPMLFTKLALLKVYDKLFEITTNDRNYSDRFIGMAVNLSKIPVNDLRKKGRGYSKNTLLPKHYTELKEAIRNGAKFFHGVKSEEVLEIIKTTSKNV